MKNTYFSHKKEDTQKLGKKIAKEALLQLEESSNGAVVLALSGDLGAGKTTFSQGFLSALKIKGPYTSPTFVVMKKYLAPLLENGAVYHIDAYRIKAEDILSLGWEEILDGKNIVLLEWADRVKEILPKNTLNIHFEWVGEGERRIILGK